MVGLDNAGKTSTVADLTGESTDGITPTVGFLNSSFSLYRFSVTVFDVGGGAKIRSIWKNYYAESYGIVFVVDASDATRLEESKKALYETEMQPRVAGKPLLVLGNKQDKEGALNENELHTQLELDTLVEKYSCPCKVFCCSAVLGKGNKIDRQIKKGFRWLLTEISNDHVNLSRRVEKDMAEQKKAQDEERERKRERVRLAREAREKAEREAAEREKQQVEESDDGVVVSKDKRKKDRETPEPQTPFKKKKKGRENNPEPDAPEKGKKSKKKKKEKQDEDRVDGQDTINVKDQTLSNPSPVEKHLNEARSKTPDETIKHSQPGGWSEMSKRLPVHENTVPEDSEVKTKKKKKKKRKLNKTAPMEGEETELPPLNAWATPSSTLNGFPGSSGVSLRRLEPLGLPHASENKAVPSLLLPEGNEEPNSLPPIRGAPWTRNRPNSEDCDVVT